MDRRSGRRRGFGRRVRRGAGAAAAAAAAMRRLGRAVRRAGRALAVVLLLGSGSAGAMCAQEAWAGGDYHVYACRQPDGQVAPVDGWSEATSQANDRATNTCASEGGLVAALDAGHSHPADTDLATWAFDAPAGETLAGATLWRAGDTAGGGNSNDSYFFWLTGVANSGESTVVFDKCNAFKGCPSEGELKNPLAATNRVEVPEKALHSPYLSLNASCGSLISGSECSSSPGDENGNAAIVELFAADMVLNQESAPTVQEVKGPLAEAATVSGTTDIAFTATDSGSGVYEAVFQVDGQTVHTTVLSTNGGRCEDVGQTTDGLPAFLYTQPCAASLSVDVPFDTTALSDGSHHVVVSVTDAAGNATPAMDRQVTVANHPAGEGAGGGGAGGSGGSPGSGSGTGTGGQSPNGSDTGGAGAGTAGAGAGTGASGAGAGTAGPAARGAANGSEASDEAALSARWKGASGARLTSAYGQRHTLEGRLTAPGGHPIAGAAIEVGALPAAAGAHAAALPSVRTNAQGRFSLGLPRTLPSTTVQLSYRSHLGDALPVATRTLTLAVRVDALLHASPTLTSVGRTVRFSGRLLGGAIPPGGKQLILEGRSTGEPWTEFEVVRTNAQGVFHGSHRFHLPGPLAYSFRALSGYEADYPFLAGSSNVVGVLER
jgi:hypothetical protein